MRTLLNPFEYLFYILGVLLAFLIAGIVLLLYPITLGKSKTWAEKWLSKVEK